MKTVLLIGALAAYCSAVQVDHGNPNAFEGDIGLDPYTRSLVNGKLSAVEAFKGTTGRIWSGGVVPYVYDRYFDNRRRQLMNSAMEQYHRRTCVRFVPQSNQRDYVKMVNQNACWSIIGRSSGQQLLKMGGHCLQLGTAIHELMHAVGFFHEQSRYDRENFVNIYWNNIQNRQSYNFQKYRSNYYGQAYDLNSIMHYRNTEFSRNGRNTIESKRNPRLRLGNTDFSTADLNAINDMYNCNIGTGGPQPTPSSCNDSNTRCLEWQQRGECHQNTNWMLVNCRKSCKQC